MERLMTKRDKHDIEIKTRFFREFEDLVDLAPQYTIAELMYTILFRNAGKKDPYFFTGEQILKKVELTKASIEKDYSEETYDDNEK